MLQHNVVHVNLMGVPILGVPPVRNNHHADVLTAYGIICQCRVWRVINTIN